MGQVGIGNLLKNMVRESAVYGRVALHYFWNLQANNLTTTLPLAAYVIAHSVLMSNIIDRCHNSAMTLPQASMVLCFFCCDSSGYVSGLVVLHRHLRFFGPLCVPPLAWSNWEFQAPVPDKVGSRQPVDIVTP